MLKKILIFALIAAMLTLASCRVVEVIDHGTTAPEETTAPRKEYSPWGFWHSYDTSTAVELIENGNAVKLYSLTDGYYEYYHVDETTYTREGDTFTVVWNEKTYTLTFNKFANTLAISNSIYVHQENAPKKHPEFSYPDYATINSAVYVSVGDIDYESLRSTVLEGASYDIAMAFYGDMNQFPKLENVSRPAQSGDVVNIDFCGKLDGVAFEGGTATGATLFVSDYKNGYIPGFTDGIIGKSVGETFDVPVTFPKNYNEPNLAGKAVIFTMTLNSICDMTLTDEEIAEYKENDYQTYAEWLEVQKIEVAKSLFPDTLLDACTALENPPIDAYAYFYQQALDYYHWVAYYYGISYEQLLSYYEINDLMILQQALNQATYNMAIHLLAKENDLVWTEEAYSTKYEEYVTGYLENYKDASREEACEYADKYITQIKHELTEDTVLEWALKQIFPAQ